MRKFLLLGLIIVFSAFANAQQKKVLFDATKSETASNADWIIDADSWNLGYDNGSPYIGGNEANAQRYPTPSQDDITQSTAETYWTGALSAWGVELVKAGYYVETLPYDAQITYNDPSNPQDLSNYQLFIVCEPNTLFSDAEKTAILNYVYNGGSLFIIADHDGADRDGDGKDAIDVWNDLFTNNSLGVDYPFGFEFNYEYFTDDTYNINNTSETAPLVNGSYGNVYEVEFYGGTNMTLLPANNPSTVGVVYGSSTSPGGISDVFVAMGSYGNGRFVAFGDSSPFDDGTGDYNDNLYNGWTGDASGNHRRLIMNASIWLLNNPTEVQSAENQKLIIQNIDFNTVNFYSPLHEKGHLQIFNILGQKIISTSFDTNKKISLEQSGVYFYVLITSTNKIYKGKFTIY